MIHSSVLIHFFLTLLGALERWYKQSLLYRFFRKSGGAIKRTWFHSNLYRVLAASEGMAASSVTFSICRFLYRLLNTLAEWVRIRVYQVVRRSTSFQVISAFEDSERGMSVFGLASMGFGLSLLILGLFHGFFSGMAGLVFLLVGFFARSFSNDLEKKVQTSRVMRGFQRLWRLFLHDEEVMRWRKE